VEAMTEKTSETEHQVLLATIGSLGDLFPFIAIAKELKRLGLKPIIASQSDYRQLVTDHFIEFLPIPPSFAEAEKKHSKQEKK
jgi:rhamnosyltransferase subunit B